MRLCFLFFSGGLSEKWAQLFLGECDLHRIYDMVLILLSFLCSYDNLKTKFHQEKRSYPDEGWLFMTDSKFEVCQD